MFDIHRLRCRYGYTALYFAFCSVFCLHWNTYFRRELREEGCLSLLLAQLRSPSLTIVSNSCGTLWNFSARNPEDQELLWELGAVPMLQVDHSLLLRRKKYRLNCSGSSSSASGATLWAWGPSNTSCRRSRTPLHWFLPCNSWFVSYHRQQEVRGTLEYFFAHIPEDQEVLWEIGAVSMLQVGELHRFCPHCS